MKMNAFLKKHGLPPMKEDKNEAEQVEDIIGGLALD